MELAVVVAQVEEITRVTADERTKLKRVAIAAIPKPPRKPHALSDRRSEG